MKVKHIFVLIMSIVLVYAVLACTKEATPEANTTTMLATQNANLSTRLQSLEIAQARQAEQIAAQGTIIAHLATKVGVPVVVPTTITPTPPESSSVQGSIEIEGGRCCVGGTAGETIEVAVDLEASSPAAEVTEMRVRSGGMKFDAAQMEAAEWEPFTERKHFPVKVAINWVGFYVSVQYRDAQGNLSPVYHDDISVEGHPPDPTP